MASYSASSSAPEHSRKKVCYFYDPDVGLFEYGTGHPMKPFRLRMTHNLILSYGLYEDMHVLRQPKLSAEDMTCFHSDDYINVLKNIRGSGDPSYSAATKERYNLANELECPVFDGLFEFCQLSAGGSVAGAVQLNREAFDIGINWSGGLHHAKVQSASGFCYVNDVVLAILELLKVRRRVLYIDIDVHHGDGVEEAFYTTDRVMTLSFHQFENQFFPTTGSFEDIGANKGKYYAVNVPLSRGIDDDSFQSIFKPVVSKIIEMYRPEAIVLQCGADSLARDKIGSFNLTTGGHGECVKFVRNYGIPLLLLGGGGYTMSNVARCWTYETAIAIGKDIPVVIPYNDYFEHLGPVHLLHTPATNMVNENSRENLENLKAKVMDNLRMLPYAPSVQMQDIPKDAVFKKPPRKVKNVKEKPRIPNPLERVVPDNELSDSEDEGDGRKNELNHKMANFNNEDQNGAKGIQPEPESDHPMWAAEALLELFEMVSRGPDAADNNSRTNYTSTPDDNKLDVTEEATSAKPIVVVGSLEEEFIAQTQSMCISRCSDDLFNNPN